MRVQPPTATLVACPSRTAASPGRDWISLRSCGAPSDALVIEGRLPLFFGRRHGRTLRPGQKALIRDFLPECALTIPASGQLDPRDVFGVRGPIWLEIGFGGGEHLAIQAEHHPEISFIGCEIFENGI